MTDTKTLIRDATPAPPPERTKLLDISAIQLVGGALAAMTSAVIGARLGVAGTVIGAAIGSLVAGVAGSLYTASLKHGKDRLSSALVGKVGDTPVGLSTVSDDRLVPDQNRVPDPTVVSDRNRLGPPAAGSWSWDPTAEPAAVAPASSDPVAADVVVDRHGQTVKRWPWKAILVSTAAVFLLAIAGITAFELVSGQSVSGGEGTTVSQVREGSGGSRTDPEQAPTSTTPSESSTTPSSEPSVSSEPHSTASSEPSSEPSASSQPSESTDPSTSSEPRTSAPPSAQPSTAASQSDQTGADAGEAGAVAGG